MGERFIKYQKQLFKLAGAAAFPALILFGGLVACFVIKGAPGGTDPAPLYYFRLLLLCYAASFIVTCVTEYKSLIHAATRADSDLIGRCFGSFRKQDRLFCEGMSLYSQDRARAALESFLQVKDYELTDSESGVLAFYIGRCYQMLKCPSNAVSFYQEAREKGFSAPYAMLFEARSHAEGGDYKTSLQLFTDLLEHNPPKDFYFLYTDIGFLFIRQKLPDQAAEWFEKSIAKKQNYAFALSGMAIASLQKGDFTAAQDYHYKALVNHLDDPNSFRKYFEETRRLMLEMHPDWSEKTGAAPAAEQTEPAAANSES